MSKSFRRMVQKLIEKLRWFMCIEKHDFHGIALHVHVDADETCREKVAKALELIWEFDPEKYKSIWRLLPGGIAIDEPKSTSGEYDHARKMCYLNYDYVNSYCPEDISLVIVHELCHARLMCRGIGYEEQIRFRVEKVCIRRELAFARILDQHYEGEDHFVSRTEAGLESIMPEYYSDAAFRKRARQNTLLQLRSLKDLDPPIFIRRWAVTRLRRKWLRERAKNARMG